ncbi:MAG: A24 family peptidase [Bdellovibrionia bacterium]
MLGKIEFIKYLILGVAGLATLTDLFFGKIYNWITLPTALSGILASYYFLGWPGVGQALLGFLGGLLFYGWLFGLRIIGGGDVKLLMAFGALAGPEYTLQVALLGIVIGGAFAFVILLASGRLLGFLLRFYNFLLTLFIRELEVQLPKVDKAFTMPFGIPLSIAAVWVAFANPFLHFGGLWLH